MAKLKPEVFVLCDYTSVSQEQKLSINGIFDRFYVDKLPINWPRMFLVTVLKGNPDQKYSITLRVVPPATVGSNMPDKKLDVTLGNNGRFNLITELINFPLPVTGVYRVIMLDDAEQIGELEFEVIAKAGASVPTPSLKRTLN